MSNTTQTCMSPLPSTLDIEDDDEDDDDDDASVATAEDDPADDNKRSCLHEPLDCSVKPSIRIAEYVIALISVPWPCTPNGWYVSPNKVADTLSIVGCADDTDVELSMTSTRHALETKPWLKAKRASSSKLYASEIRS